MTAERMSSPFCLQDAPVYQAWRESKLQSHPRSAQELVVDIADPRQLSTDERGRLQNLCARANMVVYRSPVLLEDKALPRLLGAQMGLHRLDGNWLADEDGISPIAVAKDAGNRPAFIPYTNRAIKWHTDGYYHPQTRNIQAMVLHCVRRAQEGGESAVMDHEMAYMAMRDANPRWIAALMQPDAMTIPERLDDDGIARAEQSGPVFSVDPATGVLHMRYTARTRSIVWKDDADTKAAVVFLENLLASDVPYLFRLTLQPGMGLLCNNVLHDRSGFVDDPQHPRLLYRARYLDRISAGSDTNMPSALYSYG
jgi:alpha-ketoglutarate-dependent taurine dioxygenase